MRSGSTASSESSSGTITLPAGGEIYGPGEVYAVNVRRDALSIFLIRENPEDLFDVDTGTFNEAAFLKMIHENIYTREKFHVILFTVSNMDMIREGYGSQTGKACLRTIMP